MAALYLVPDELVIDTMPRHGPKYFAWRFGAGTLVAADWIDYGFLGQFLVYAPGLSVADQAVLAGQPDVYVWPENLDAGVTDPSLETVLESIHIPMDWTTPSTTYREVLRRLYGLFQFEQRFAFISQGHSLFEQGVNLETNYRQMPATIGAWCDATIASFGWPAVAGNPKLRSLTKQIGDVWASQPFNMAGVGF